MGVFTVGEVVIIQFPFSNLSTKKYRPALVVGKSDFSNLLVVQISSKLLPNTSGVSLSNDDFVDTTPLQQTSFIRCNKIFTADTKLIVRSIGSINNKKRAEIKKKILQIFEKL